MTYDPTEEHKMALQAFAPAELWSRAEALCRVYALNELVATVDADHSDQNGPTWHAPIWLALWDAIDELAPFYTSDPNVNAAGGYVERLASDMMTFRFGPYRADRFADLANRAARGQ